MACYATNDATRPAFYLWKTVDRQYASKQECDQECDGAATGACRNFNNTGCVEVRPCQCYQQFLGIGTRCNPLP